MAIVVEASRPGVSVKSEPAVPTSPRRLRRWLHDNSQLGDRELAHRLDRAIGSLNRADLSGRERLRLLECLRPGLRGVLDHLAGRVHGQPLPLSASAQEACSLELDLLRAFASGYSAALTDQRTNHSHRNHALAAERALALHGEHMLRSAQTYSRVDDTIWDRIHSVYLATEAAGTSEQPVEDRELRFAPRQRQSPRIMYQRVLLFALAGTEGFRRDEVQRLYRALESWSELARVRMPGHGESSDQPHFVIEPDTARPPQLLEELPRDRPVRLLEIEQLVEHVKSLWAQRSRIDTPVPAENELTGASLARLLDNWRPRKSRRYQRAEPRSRVEAEITLHAIHARLGGRSEEESGLEVVEMPFGLVPMQTSEDSGPIIGPPGSHPSSVQPGEVLPGQEVTSAQASQLEEQGGAGLSPRSDWLLEDISATGFRLTWEGDGLGRAGVGEPIALRLPNTGEQERWLVGIVRHMHFTNPRRFTVGVLKLSAGALAARIRREPETPNELRHRDDEPSAPALLLRSERTRGLPGTLLVPAHMFREGEVLEMDVRNRVVRIALGTLREDTGLVSLHELKLLPGRVSPGSGQVGVSA